MTKAKNKIPTFQAEVARISKLLRKEIYAGHRLPHEHLTESKLAKDYCANRMIIRQVLNELAAGGLVSIEPYKGASVAAVTIDQIYETFNVVAMLEGFSAHLAVKNITDQDINKLRGNLEKQKKIKPGDSKHWQSLNYKFHRLINQKSGNRQIIHLLRQNTQFTNYWFLSVPSVDFKIAIKAHENIVQALMERDGEKARKYMEEHINARVTRLVNHVKERIPLGMFRSV
jgi:DNA-binding GntR family transcriptional regulator